MSETTLTRWEGHNADFWRRAWGAGSVAFFDTLASTNDVAAELASAAAPHFSVIVADQQTRGRGRGGSIWQAAPGSSLLFSVLFRLDRPGSAPGSAPVRTGLAVAEAISKCARAEALVKWPNDVVFAQHGKVAGILCEGALAAQGPGYVIAGIGINVYQQAAGFTGELHGRACSILSATGVRVDRSTLLTEVLNALGAAASTIVEPLTDAELERLQRRDVLRDQAVICETPAHDQLAGTARGIERDGALLVEQSNGLTPVYNATVRLADTQVYPGSRRTT